MVISAYISSSIVDPVFGSPHTHSNVEILFAIYGYAIQIYADFSGYTDIAIGIALLLGFRFPQNFDGPYTAVVPPGLLAPMAHDPVQVAARLPVHPARRQQGLRGPDRPEHHDHDDARRPVARGGLDFRRLGRISRSRAGGRPLAGATAGGARCRAGPDNRRRRVLERIATFHLVCLGWVFFRATSMSIAFTMIGRLFTAWGSAPLVTPLVVITIVGSIASQYVSRTWSATCRAASRAKLRLAQGAILGAILLGITTLAPEGVQPFIYFRF